MHISIKKRRKGVDIDAYLNKKKKKRDRWLLPYIVVNIVSELISL